jgi:hypothetical protein
MSSSRSIVSSPKAGVARLAAVAILSSCILLAAPSVASASKSGSPWDPILQGLTKSENISFSAVYQIVETTAGVTSENEAITYSQDPSQKEIALVTPSGSFYITATKTLACRSEAGHLACTQLPENLASTMTSVKNAFAPGNIESAIGTLQTEATAHGYALSHFKQSYGWTASGKPAGIQYASDCIKVSGPKMYGTGTYCSSSSYGVLTYSQGSASSTKTSTITIHAGGYTANPGASAFAPPAGTPIVPM